MDKFEQMIRRKRSLIPKTGYNVVGVDTFSVPGEDYSIFLIGHYSELAEAEEEAEKHRNEVIRVYIYGPDTA